MDFSSDTSAPAHPAVLSALADINSGMEASYGGDAITQRLRATIKELFQTEDVAVLPVGSGTAANALALSVLCSPTEAIVCHRNSHIACDERGAPEFFTGGGKLDLLDGASGKLSAETLKAACQRINRSFVHETPISTLSLTNLTESGTAYSASEVSQLSWIAKQYGLSVHLDGARLGNALVSTGASAADMVVRNKVDVLSLGFTKTGAMGCELICLFGDAQGRFDDLLARAKRAGHLPPKMRYISAQALALLGNDVWLQLARQANDAALMLADKLVQRFGASLAHAVEGNEVFAYLPDDVSAKLFASGLKAYPWADGSVRFVCHWATSKAEIGKLDQI